MSAKPRNGIVFVTLALKHKNITMKKIILLSILTVLCLSLAAKNKVQDAKLISATMLPQGAELTHTARVDLTAGTNELTLSNLAPYVDVNSIQIKCSGGVTVLGFEFSEDYLNKGDDSPAVRKLKDSVKYYNAELTRLGTALEINRDMLSLLQSNKQVGGEQNGLKVDEFMKMMDYYKAKSTELQKEKQLYSDEVKKIKDRLDKVQRQLRLEEGAAEKIAGTLSLTLANPVAGSRDVEVTYYTSSAQWIPYYDIQVTDLSKPITVISKAKLMQTTGLDWKGVKLAISTATPSGKTAQKFETWFLNYVTPSYRNSGKYYKDGAMQNSFIPQIQMDQSEASVQAEQIVVRGTSSASDTRNPLYVVNGEIMDDVSHIDSRLIESMSVLKDASSTAIYGSRAANGVVLITLKDSYENFVATSESEIDFTYTLEQPYDLTGNGKEQIVTLRSFEMPATYEYYCAPKLDKATFLLANIEGWESYNLLPGEANITREGTFVGKSYIDPYSTQRTMSLTLGVDNRVVVKREKLQDFSGVKMLASSKQQIFTYQLTVKNTKNIPVKMVLKDQYPISMQKDIDVQVAEDHNASHVNKEVGVLTWSFELAPGETQTFKHSYTVKYPKNKILNL